MGEPSRRRTKQSTDEFFKDVLEKAERDSWDKPGKKSSKAIQKRGKQLSSLYGSNSTGALVKRRASTLLAPGDATSGYSRRNSQLPAGFANSTDILGGALGGLGQIDEGGATASGLPGRPPRRLSVIDNAKKYVAKQEAVRARERAEVPPGMPRGGGKPAMVSGGGRVPKSSSQAGGGSSIEGSNPWYCGYTNSPASPPSSHFARVARYGLQGTLSMARLHRPQICAPAGDAGWTPNFLHKPDLCNEWAEPLSGSPALWPTTSEFVSGSTLDPWREPVEVDPRLRRVMSREEEELRRVQVSLQHLQQHQLATSKKLRATAAAKQAKQGGSKHKGKGDGKVSVRDANRLKYWSSLTVIYGERDEAHARLANLEKARVHRLQRLEMKWREVLYLHKIMKMPAYRKPGLEDLTELKEYFLHEMLPTEGDGGHRGRSQKANVLLTRDQFMTAIQFFFDAADPKVGTHSRGGA